MKIDHVHFYVEDARASRDWFVDRLGFQAVASGASHHTCTEVVSSGPVCFVLSSPLTLDSPVAWFLDRYSQGVADLAFLVQDVEVVMERAVTQGAKVLQPVQQRQLKQGCIKWGKIAAWGALSHTLIERIGITPLLPDTQLHSEFVSPLEAQEMESGGDERNCWQRSPQPLGILSPYQPRLTTAAYESTQLSLNPIPQSFIGIDHIVLNVAAGDLERAAVWYENTLGFTPQQKFAIQTDRSALHSQVMVHPGSRVKLPINEPASANSQIQEFLDVNHGSGIQHIALQTNNIVQTIRQLRLSGLPFLSVFPAYYTQLRQRPGLLLSEAQLQEIAQEEILVDWENNNPQALLLQTFTQPIFGQPTFFFELIERRSQAKGFGEGNFHALFAAIEQEQLKRGSLN